MTQTYDAVIIGTGLSGLGAGALLAKAGRKVIALEKNPYIGGRTASFTHDGFTLNIGQHAGLRDQKVDQLFRQVGKEPGKREFFSDIVIYQEGEFASLMSLVPVGNQSMIDLLMEIQQLGPQEMEKLDAISARDWFDAKNVTDPVVTNLLRLNTVIMTTLPWLEDMAASSLVESVRTVFRSTDTWLASHGMGDFLRILVQAIEEKGGVVRTAAPVTQILVEDGAVRGVLVEQAEEGIGGELGEAVRIEAPLVVAAFPVWDLFRLAAPELFPRAFVEQATHLDKRTANIGISAGMNEPLYEDRKFIIHEFPRAGYPGTVFMPTNIVPTIAPKGAHLLDSSIICEFDIGRDRDKLFRKIDAMKQDVEEMFPGWQKKCRWIQPYFHWEEPARNPGREGVFRPGPKAPGIEGLYLAGDTVSSRSLPGMECACDSAMICVREILGELP